MRLRTLGRWATRLAGTALLIASTAIIVGGVMLTMMDFEWL